MIANMMSGMTSHGSSNLMPMNENMTINSDSSLQANANGFIKLSRYEFYVSEESMTQKPVNKS